MAKVFLSYDHRDSELARPIASALENAGHDVWWDRHIRGGSQFSKEIERALNDADAVVVLWSGRSIESPWVRDEAEAARDSGRLVPVRIDQSKPPLGFRQFLAIDLSAPRGKARSSQIEALVHAIEHLPTGGAPPHAAPPLGTASMARKGSSGLTRRSAVAGLAAVTAGLAGAGGYWAWRARVEQPSPEVQSLLDQAWQAWTQGGGEGLNQAIGLYRQATELAPDHADSWGLLGAAYADRAHWWVQASERPALRERAREAAQRALQLDPKNANARAAIAYARPFRGSWLHMEREYRKAIADQPGKPLVIYSLALLLGHVGRMRNRRHSSPNSTAALQLPTNPTSTGWRCGARASWARPSGWPKRRPSSTLPTPASGRRVIVWRWSGGGWRQPWQWPKIRNRPQAASAMSGSGAGRAWRGR